VGCGGSSSEKASVPVLFTPLDTVVYENAEIDISSQWIQKSGSYPPERAINGFDSQGALVLVPEWINKHTNIAEYHLDMNHSKQKTLEMDMGGLSKYTLPNLDIVGYMPHYKVGVYVQTLHGKRAMIWDSFFNHGNVEAFASGKWLSFPSPVEHVRGYEVGLGIDEWVHFRVDVEKELQKLEPDNEIITIDTFFATGGFLDNLRLSTY
jgi:hypothetical protein